jgi:hypothetical protein
MQEQEERWNLPPPSSSARGTPKGVGLPGCAPPTKPPKPKLKKTHYVDIMIAKVLRDFPFIRNQPLKSTDD